MLEKLVNQLLRFKLLWIALTLVFSLLYATQLPSLRLNNTPAAMRSPDDPDLIFSKQFIDEFGSDEILVIGFKCENVFQKDVLDMINRITKKVEKIKDVKRVLSITNFVDVFDTPEGMYIGYLISEWNNISNIQEIKKMILSDPFYSKFFLFGQNEKSTAILAELNINSEDVYYSSRIVKEVEKIVEEEGNELGIKILLGGIPIFIVSVEEAFKKDSFTINPLMFGVIFMILLWSLRQAYLAILPLLVVGISALWTMGTLAFSGRDMTWITEILPPLILVVGTSESIHILSSFRAKLHEGDVQSSVYQTVKELLIPCFLSNITTAIGFFSLVTSPIPPIREFGIFAIIGVVFTYILSFTFLPSLLQRAKNKKPSPSGPWEILRNSIAEMSGFSLRYRWGILITSALILILSVIGIQRITPDNDIFKIFKEDSLFMQNHDYLIKIISPYYLANEIILEKSDNSTVKDLEALILMDEMQSELLTFPELDKDFSLVDIVKRIHQAMDGSETQNYALPENNKLVKNYLSLYESVSDNYLPYLLSEDGRRTRMTLRQIDNLTSKESLDLYERMERVFDRFRSEGLKITLTGGITLYHKLVDAILSTQVRSFATAFIVIFVVIALMLRSFKLGIFAIIPNVFPVIVTLGMMGWLKINLDIGTTMIASIILGVVDDDTIHFLYRFRYELKEKREYASAIRTTFSHVARPILTTAIILALGFWVLTLSSYVPVIHFGFLSGVSIISALLADLLILPALLYIFKPIKS